MRILYDGADGLAEPTCHAYMQARSSQLASHLAVLRSV